MPEISFGTRQGSFSSSFASRRVSHEGERQGSEGKGEEIVQQEKRKERPELKVVISNLKPFCFCFQYSQVVICKDGRSSARVSLIYSFSPPTNHKSGPFPQMFWNMFRKKTQNKTSCIFQLRRVPPLSPRPRPSSVKIINEPLPLPWEATSRY